MRSAWTPVTLAPMKRSLFFKLAAIGAISTLLLIPLMRIDGLVNERRATRDAAVDDIARGSGLAQTITGPVLAIPAVRTLHRWSSDNASHERRLEEYQERTTYYLLPERLDVDAALDIDQRRRGIYEARLYRTQAAIRGHFQLPARFETLAAGDSVTLGPARLALGVTDIRGIGTGLTARIDDQPATFQSGTGVAFLGSGVHAPVPAAIQATSPATTGARVDFAITLPLQGTGQFELVPVGRESQVHVRSNWPHPSFSGQFLPVKRTVTGRGFDAQWQTSFFATNLEELTDSCAHRSDCKSLDAPRLGVSLIDPVDQYLQTERAIKYSVLFIALTFAGFLLCEVLKGAALHPMQYGLVGLALALFYLLLLSLAEHVGFAIAYVASAAASVALLAFYLRHALRSRALGLGFGGALCTLYGLLYGILAAEDYALLMGSVLLFGVLALFMILTRHVDWATARTG